MHHLRNITVSALFSLVMGADVPPPPAHSAEPTPAVATPGASTVPPITLTSLDGKTYTGVQELKVKPDGLSFMTEVGPQFIDFLKLDAETQRKYKFDPFAAGLARARKVRPVQLTLASAFRLHDLEKAKAKAIALGKPLGFLMVWDSFFKAPGDPRKDYQENYYAHFYHAFKDSCVLVNVRHEDELNKVPPAVGKGFFGPDEGGWSPNICITSPDVKDYICEIPLGGGKESSMAKRHEVFLAKIEVIKAYIAKNPARFVPAPPAEPAKEPVKPADAVTPAEPAKPKSASP